VEAVDPEGSPVTYQFKDYPSWLMPIGSDTIHGKPPEGAGNTHFLAIASNGFLSDTLQVRVLVTPVNDPPELVEWIFPGNYRTLFQDTTILENQLLEFFLFALDPEDSTVNLSMDTVFTPRPKGAIFVNDSTNRGRFSWKPAFGSVGTYSILFKGIEDSGSPPLSDIDTVRITVNKVLPDLYINNFFAAKNNVYIQETILTEVEVGNERAPVNHPFGIRFLKNSVIVGDTLISTGLDTGQVVIAKQRIQFLELGNHKIMVEVDYNNTITEYDEFNNKQTISISVDEGHLSVRPNPFTPNQDGYNDYVEFDFSQLVLRQPKLKIFNFSGSVVITYDRVIGQHFVWYGLNGSGKELSPGVYLYALYDGDEIVHTGSIVLAR